MKRKLNFNEFKKLGMEIDIEEKTYHIDFIPAPVEEDMLANFENLDKYFKEMGKSENSNMKAKIEDWIWSTISWDRNNNGDIQKDYFFSYLGIAECIAIIRVMSELITDRLLKMNEMFGGNEPGKQLPETDKT